jgi:hypothetical protein
MSSTLDEIGRIDRHGRSDRLQHEADRSDRVVTVAKAETADAANSCGAMSALGSPKTFCSFRKRRSSPVDRSTTDNGSGSKGFLVGALIASARLPSLRFERTDQAVLQDNIDNAVLQLGRGDV